MSSTVPGLWGFTDHCCRECLSRIMTRLDGPATRQIHRCSGCGAEAAGAVEELCACGARYRNHEQVGTRRGQMMGFRCIENPRRSSDFPAEIVVKRVPVEGPDVVTQPAFPLRVFR